MSKTNQSARLRCERIARLIQPCFSLLRSGYVLMIATWVFMGCGHRKDVVFGTSQLPNGFVLSLYLTYGYDDAILGVKVYSPSNTACYYGLQYSSYSGLPITEFVMLYSPSADAIWLKATNSTGSNLANYAFRTQRFIDKYGLLLNPSASPRTKYPRYSEGIVPPIPSDAIDCLHAKSPPL
jgi:hypothetical protein